ncbi:MAG: AIPR family protein [Burkholderiales bacterium]|nr:AIPR family protein [Burkholderiales bacterium]
MQPEEFLVELGQIVARRSKFSHLVDTLAFVNEVAERLEEDPVFGEFEQAEWEGTGSKKRMMKLHGYTHLEESDGSIGLVIGKWGDITQPTNFSSASAAELSGRLENFVRESIENDLFEKITEANPAYELAYQLYNERKRISRIRLHILTNLSLSSKFREELQGEVAGIPFERHIWDLPRLMALYQSSRERELVEINLPDFGQTGIPCIEATGDNSCKSFLCVIKGDLLADLFDRYGSRLLEGNVRSFLGMRGGVNKGIRKTIQDQPSLFFAYNNGIAATASDVIIENIHGQPTITKITDLQIVNGGQTTASVLNARKKDRLSLENVSVQMKLTKVNQIEAHDLVPRIAEYANTQNKVNVADFFANHPFHRKMEEISRRLLTPARAGMRIQSKWFYERSRGQYQNERLYLSQSQKNAFDSEYPPNHLVNKTDLAKFDNTWNEKPQWVSLGAQKNFIKFAAKFEGAKDQGQAAYWETISPHYGEAYFRHMMAVAVIWKTMEKIVDEARGDWYEGGYRANIVTYTIAKLAHLARSQDREIDLEAIWNRQVASPELSRILSSMAHQVQDVLVNPPEGEKNVGEWCKKDQCWKDVMDLELSSPHLSEVTISKEEFNLQKTEEKKQGAIDDGISIQETILGLTTSGYWNALYLWDQSRELFTPQELSLLLKASTIQGVFKIALEKDWRRLIQVRDKADDEGFRYS